MTTPKYRIWLTGLILTGLVCWLLNYLVSLWLVARIQERIQQRLNGATVVFENVQFHLWSGYYYAASGRVRKHFDRYCDCVLSFNDLRMQVNLPALLERKLEICQGRMARLELSVRETATGTLLDKCRAFLKAARLLWRHRRKKHTLQTLHIHTFTIEHIKLTLYEHQFKNPYQIQLQNIQLQRGALWRLLLARLPRPLLRRGRKLAMALRLLSQWQSASDTQR